MFGIHDPLILLPYLMMVGCVIFAIAYGVKYWNQEEPKDDDL